MSGARGRLVLRAARAVGSSRDCRDHAERPPVGRTRSRPPNSQRFHCKQNACGGDRGEPSDPNHRTPNPLRTGSSGVNYPHLGHLEPRVGCWLPVQGVPRPQGARQGAKLGGDGPRRPGPRRRRGRRGLCSLRRCVLLDEKDRCRLNGQRGQIPPDAAAWASLALTVLAESWGEPS